MFPNYAPIQNIIFVSEEEARNYILPPNSKVLLMDRNKPVFYIKTSDSLGQTQLDTYTFKKETPPNENVTQADFNTFKQEILALLNQNKTEEVKQDGESDIQQSTDNN